METNKKLENAGIELWETLCLMELKRRKNSSQYITESKKAGFKKCETYSPTKNTHLVIFKNLYYDEILISLNILDFDDAPFWIVMYLLSCGFEVPMKQFHKIN